MNLSIELELREAAATLPLVDHHAHGVLRSPVERHVFEAMLTEAPRSPVRGTQFDSQIGFAIRRWCSPLLDLPVHASPEAYWNRRTELGELEVGRRMLEGAGVDTYLMDSGFLAEELLSPADHGQLTAATIREIVRLEPVAEELLTSCRSPEEFVEQFPYTLAQRSREAVGTKSIVAYRYGFDFPADRPNRTAVARAVDEQLARARHRVDHPVLLSFLLWCAVDLGLPVQLHSGFGDRDLDLNRANPLLLTTWLRNVEDCGVPILLLHNYPFHREAGYLAQVFEHVYFDIGLAVNHVGSQARQVIAESLEVAPFHKQLFSSDGCGPAELHFLGAALWRDGMFSVLSKWVDEGLWSGVDAVRVLELIARENAVHIYRLSG